MSYKGSIEDKNAATAPRREVPRVERDFQRVIDDMRALLTERTPRQVELEETLERCDRLWPQFSIYLRRDVAGPRATGFLPPGMPNSPAPAPSYMAEIERCCGMLEEARLLMGQVRLKLAQFHGIGWLGPA